MRSALEFVLPVFSLGLLVSPTLSLVLPGGASPTSVSTAGQLTQLFRLNPTTAAHSTQPPVLPGSLVSVVDPYTQNLQAGVADPDAIISTSWLSGHIPLGINSVYGGLPMHAFWVWNPNRMWKQIGTRALFYSSTTLTCTTPGRGAV